MIYLESQDLPVPSFLQEQSLSSWLSLVADGYGKQLGDVTVICCSDEHLLGVNRQFLDHDYYTDIITFDYSEDELVSGDLFISLDRVKENAESNQETYETELHRVVVHGVLHLCGLTDKDPESEKAMRFAEDQALKLRQ